jgi:hypothetical protein
MIKTLPPTWLKAVDSCIGELLGETTSDNAAALRNYWLRIYSESVFPARPGKKEIVEIGHDLAVFYDGWLARGEVKP